MYTTIAILASVFIIIELIRTLSNRNWKLIYSTFGNEEYFRIIAKLRAQGIKYKIKSPFRGFDNRIDRFKDYTQYDIYVKKDEEHKAVKAIQIGS